MGINVQFLKKLLYHRFEFARLCKYKNTYSRIPAGEQFNITILILSRYGRVKGLIFLLFVAVFFSYCMLNKRQPGLQLEFILQGGTLRNNQTSELK